MYLCSLKRFLIYRTEQSISTRKPVRVYPLPDADRVGTGWGLTEGDETQDPRLTEVSPGWRWSIDNIFSMLVTPLSFLWEKRQARKMPEKGRRQSKGKRVSHLPKATCLGEDTTTSGPPAPVMSYRLPKGFLWSHPIWNNIAGTRASLVSFPLWQRS